jgi:hypothetical protein
MLSLETYARTRNRYSGLVQLLETMVVKAHGHLEECNHTLIMSSAILDLPSPKACKLTLTCLAWTHEAY